MTVNPPWKHHYLPEFYLRQWCGEDRRLMRFSRYKTGAIHCRRVYPSEAGFAENLYRIPGEHNDEWKAQQLETDFFSPVDGAAARSLNKLLNEQKPLWDSDSRTAWSRFLLSLFHRSPEHLEATVAKLRELNAELMPEVQRDYERLRGPSDPEKFEDWEHEYAPLAVDRSAFKILPQLIDNENLGSFINHMEWGVVDLREADYPLLTSDNAIIFVPLKRPEGHLALAISPTKLFVAANNPEAIAQLKTASPRQIVRQANRLAVERAHDFVIGADDFQRPFIEKHFGSRPIGSLATGFSAS